MLNNIIYHGTQWYKKGRVATRPINRTIQQRSLKISMVHGDELTKGCDLGKKISRLDFFLSMFPPTQLEAVIDLTNKKLQKHNHKRTTNGELLKWFGVLIIITRFEFGSRRDVWSQTPSSKYVLALCLGNTGVTKHRFDTLWRLVCLSKQDSLKQS